MVDKEVRDARGQGLGFAGAGGREDLEDWGWGGDGGSLGGVEVCEDGVGV